MNTSRKDVLPFQKGHFQGFQEGIWSLSKKGYSCNFKRSAPPTKKASSREFKKGYVHFQKELFHSRNSRYAPSPKRIIPRNSRRDILQKRLFQGIQEGVCSPKQKGLFHGIQEGICAPFKKSYSREFKDVFFPSLKMTFPRNSRRDILPLQKGYSRNQEEIY